MILGLAPMDGITNLPYRTIVQRIFQQYQNTSSKSNQKTNLRTRTEFMNVDGYMIQPDKLVQHLIHHNEEKNLIAQIYGGTEQTLLQTAIDIEQKYPQFMGIELNIGCPSPKVMVCGGGSGMMQNKQNTLRIIKKISKVVSKPFSIKVRTGINEDDKKERFATLLQAAPYVHCITIHGRTIKQGHSGPVDRQYIHHFKQEVGNQCLVIGNGGIFSYKEALHYIHSISPYVYKSPDTSLAGETHTDTQLDGIMIGQSAIANPRIFTAHTPTLSERYNIILQHLYLAVAYEIRCIQHISPIKSMNENEDTSSLGTNKKFLHALKQHYKNNDDSPIENIGTIQRHKYVVAMPKIEEINEIAEKIQKDPSLSFLNTTSSTIHTPITFRKYLFNYIHGLPQSKELKIQVAKTNDLATLYTLITNYFTSMSTKGDYEYSTNI